MCDAVVISWVSIHAPRTGRDLQYQSVWQSFDLFQSTRPARGATCQVKGCLVLLCCFNPRAPHGARPRRQYSCLSGLMFQSTRPARGATHRMMRAHRLLGSFNPRAPHGARLFLLLHFRRCEACFNPRAPHGARQKAVPYHVVSVHVSIHAPRTGRDQHILTY